MIHLQSVTKRYGKLAAVDDITLRVGEGELFGFLGPNGAGKTTTLKMIAGLLHPTSGSITVAGRDIAAEPEAVKRLTGYVPDSPFVYDRLTGREFLRFVSGIYRLEKAAAGRAIERYLDLFELGGWADELVRSYSHGMKQKLVMSAALIHSPRVLIVDEPMVGLDPKSAVTVKKIFRELVAGGVTIFLSTHTLGVAEQLCDRIGIIQQGRLATVGGMEELRARAGDPHSRLEDIFLELTGGPDMEKIVASLGGA
ncbi:ABC transporter ATP-binding protein [bacterium]|nr:ABC transporter ATP-binding protein [candidate division CSSED10-310 bacterium]